METTEKKQLSFFEAAMLVTGSGLGTGILAVPYLVSRLGIIQTILTIGVACGVSILLHLMVADLALRSSDSLQLLGIFQQHLFRGRWKKAGTMTFFCIMLVMLLLNLSLYTVCAAEVLVDITGLPESVNKVIFYLIASAVVALGIKSIGISEKISMILIGITVAALGMITLSQNTSMLPFSSGSFPVVLALYSISMFSFSALFSVPQVVTYMKGRSPSRIRRVVVTGIASNAVLTFFFAMIVSMSGSEITAVATIGLSAKYGQTVQILCAIFVILAMLTSFLSIAFAQMEILEEKTRMPVWVSWLLATLPVAVSSLLLPIRFLDYIELVGGVFAIIVVLMVLPAYRNAVKSVSRSSADDELMLGRGGRSKIVLFGVLSAYMVMAAASFISIA